MFGRAALNSPASPIIWGKLPTWLRSKQTGENNLTTEDNSKNRMNLETMW